VHLHNLFAESCAFNRLQRCHEAIFVCRKPHAIPSLPLKAVHTRTTSGNIIKPGISYRLETVEGSSPEYQRVSNNFYQIYQLAPKFFLERNLRRKRKWWTTGAMSIYPNKELQKAGLCLLLRPRKPRQVRLERLTWYHTLLTRLDTNVGNAVLIENLWMWVRLLQSLFIHVYLDLAWESTTSTDAK